MSGGSAMTFTMEGASGVAFVITFFVSLTLLRIGFWRTSITAAVVYWIAFLLLRVMLDIPEPLSGDAPPILTQAAAALQDGVRMFLAAPGEILEGIGTFVSDDLAATGRDYVTSLEEGPFAGDPYWTSYPSVHVARVVGRTVAAIVVVYVGKLLFGGALWLIWPRRSRQAHGD
jgi:hypothetical protein